MILGLEFDQESRLEFLRLLYKFCVVYSGDFKKSEIANTLLPSILNFTQSILPSTTPTEFLFLLQVWVQLRDSEHEFFTSNLETLQAMLTSFLDLNFQTLSQLYYDD